MPTASINFRRFAGVACLLAGLCVACAVTVGFQKDRTHSAVTEDDLALVQAHVDALVDDVRDVANGVAQSEAIVQALADVDSSSIRDARLFAALEGFAQPHTGIELYEEGGSLLAWSGSNTFPDAGDHNESQDAPRLSIASDDLGGRALELKAPIRLAGTSIGFVRVLRTARVSVPVRNQFLGDYDISDEWQSHRVPPFTVSFGQEPADGSLSLSGETLGVVSGQQAIGSVTFHRETEQQLIARTTRTTNSILHFWIFVSCCWILGGIWFIVDRSAQRARGEDAGWTKVTALLFGWLVLLIGVRHLMLKLDVPSVWLSGHPKFDVMFDPAVLASGFAGGWMGSVADLIVSAGVLFVGAIGFLRVALLASAHTRKDSWMMGTAGTALSTLIALGVASVCVYGFVNGVRFAVLDSTITFFDQTSVPSAVVPRIVLLGLILLGVAATTAVTSSFLFVCTVWRRPVHGSVVVWLTALGCWVLILGGVNLFVELNTAPTWVVVALLLSLAVALAGFLRGASERWNTLVSLQGALVCVILIVPVVYLAILPADRQREDEVMVAAADDFARGQDRRLIFAMEGVLAEATSDDLLPILESASQTQSTTTAFPDSVTSDMRANLASLISGSLLGSLADYSVGVTVYGVNADSIASYADSPPAELELTSAIQDDKDDPIGFESLRNRFDAQPDASFHVSRQPVARSRGTYRYAGIGPIRDGNDQIAAWLYVRAIPKLQRYIAETPFPRVLVPSGFFGDDDEAFSYAEYDNGVLVRSRGAEEGPSQLELDVRRAFADERLVHWHEEELGSQPFRTYYRRFPTEEKREPLDAVAVRVRSETLFDHLFNLLRLTVAGLILSLLVFLIALPIRRRAGLLPKQRIHFRDKVMSRFLLVGVATVILTAIIGQQVIEEQQRQSVRDLLIQRLQRVQASVASGAGGGIPIANTMENVRADVISSQLGLDVHVFEGANLVSTSRPQLVRQRLIDDRLPPSVYQDLFVSGQRYAFAEQQIGSFSYTTGFRAVADESGRPIGAVAVPTLPEQEAIEVGQARMIAYLFGVLLLMLVGIGGVAAILANQLTRPLSRLRKGLLAVGEGRKSEPLPIETRDEMGELAETFNEMQAQLEENKQRLAQQERELAWREMAQQVAHEIKNPLTPMKLSVQHLQRSYPGQSDEENDKFGMALRRISTTLVEQIDALSRIAGDFSSFARLPKRNVEIVDLHNIIREASDLFRDEIGDSDVLSLMLHAERSHVEADKEELRRVYINLYKNALQAVPEGKMVEINVETKVEEENIVSLVSDTGSGIPYELRSKIFQPNFSTKSSGMGLGLAIAQKAIEASGGFISFETEVDKGTTFRIVLPLQNDT